MKYAKVVYGKTDGNQRTVMLRAGAKGTGQILLKVSEWPWSTESKVETYKMVEKKAADLGYTIVED